MFDYQRSFIQYCSLTFPLLLMSSSLKIEDIPMPSWYDDFSEDDLSDEDGPQEEDVESVELLLRSVDGGYVVGYRFGMEH
jgi:hypothetical protein